MREGIRVTKTKKIDKIKQFKNKWKKNHAIFIYKKEKRNKKTKFSLSKKSCAKLLYKKEKEKRNGKKEFIYKTRFIRCRY